MSKQASPKSDQLRTMVAQEAARLIQEHGLEDFRAAKSRAADRLGLRNLRSLPSNREIESAVAERNRIFRGAQHSAMLGRLRETAVAVMCDLQSFRPRLVGTVLSGHATEHSLVELHLFSDSAETVGLNLSRQGISHHLVQRRHRVRRDVVEAFPGFRFYFTGVPVAATVFPERRQAHAPMSPVDGRPMRRANLREVELLLNRG